MAVHYDDYGDYGGAYDVAPAGYDEPPDEYTRDEFALYEEEPYASDGAYYEEVEADDGLMETEYGEPGYWEEYHRRRYEILYGSDSEGDEGVTDVYDEETHVAFEAAAAPYSYGEPDAGPHAEEVVVAEAVEHGREPIFEAEALDEDDILAWRELWERGPSMGENELAWAEAMDAWRQRIEASAYEDESTVEDLTPAAVEEGPICAPSPIYVEPTLDEAPPMTLEELQASYDRGEIPEEDRAECARMLGELWACELEDQRLLAAGYVWDDELGEYVHPDGSDSSEEYDAEEEDVVWVEHADVPNVPLTALAGAHTPSFSSHHTPPPELPKHQLAPRRRFPRSAKLKSPLEFRNRRCRMFIPAQRRPLPPVPRAPRSKLRRRTNKGRTTVTSNVKRDLPPHLALVVSSAESTNLAPSTPSAAVSTIVPAPSATPPPVADDSRCSLATVPIVAASILDAEDPLPPDIPTFLSAAPPTNKNPVPDAVVIPRVPKPPNILVTATTTSSVSHPIPVSPPVPACTSVIDAVLRVPVPKPPKIAVPASAQVVVLNASAQRRRNAQRRIAKKGKG
ncbi:hypothetical protein C8R43DRAFT_1235155 [Mycena crocata]|nr:hypothetical protein C8R43DRAFT_1235155 [Mycena crocata]